MADAGGDWVLVTAKKRNRKPHAHRPQQTHRSGTGHGHVTHPRKTTATPAMAVDAIDRDARISSDKQRKIQARVERITTALVGATRQQQDGNDTKPALVSCALRAIANHLGWRSEDDEEDNAVESTHPNEYEPSLRVVSYGLGSFCSSSNAVHQLAFVHALVQAATRLFESFNESIRHPLTTTLEIFDPVMNASDREIAAACGMTTLDQNECGHRVATNKTVFYMPHCGHALYQNVLIANYHARTLDNVLIIGNSFEAYSDRLLDTSARRASVLISVLPFVTEVPLPVGIPASHDEFPLYEAAFNDLSIHWFSPDQAKAALASVYLETLIQDTTNAVAVASGSVLSTAIDRELLV